MCGIALTVSGIRINISSLPFDSTSPNRQSENLVISLDDLKEALRRRGPDSLGVKKVNFPHNDGNGELCFIGATLQLRGTLPLVQPLVDASRNILLYNGTFCYFV
ncbi:asparagine synthetase domain-containing protein 1-like [Trifolium medium]|uniref:Asparagine synthetase domain-containing protein 1-like n=1 Tax=Trifolium medium TaxID=97028 RepID=A0A392N990_9FABA|nr:asparagine synthetase domain-containing protein 1-like [Trifolium medium]